ncbi:MAG: hypothetical protein LBI69_00070 [Puniceicoccales bacterium]|jgi:hypothetical protein|nr:hypothetical protein [Puniceicoccales bacterium]
MGEFILNLINTYLKGHDTYSTVTKIPIAAEIFQWKRLLIYTDAAEVLSSGIRSAINEHLDVLEKVKEKRLNFPEQIRKYTQEYRKAKKNEAGREEKKSPHDDLPFFMRESNAMYPNINANLSSNIWNPNHENIDDFEMRTKQCRYIEQGIIDEASKIFKVTEEGDSARRIFDSSNAADGEESSYIITDEEKDSKQCAEFQSSIKSFQAEMNDGGLNQKKRRMIHFYKATS